MADFKSELEEMCELLHTSLLVQKMHVVEKAGYPLPSVRHG
jgi:hypothetical protein